MIKTSLIALATVAAVSLAAFPASAEATSSATATRTSPRRASSPSSSATASTSTSVEDWSGYVRAFVTLEDGRQVQRFFDAGHAAARSDRRPRRDRPRALTTLGAADSYRGGAD